MHAKRHRASGNTTDDIASILRTRAPAAGVSGKSGPLPTSPAANRTHRYPWALTQTWLQRGHGQGGWRGVQAQ